MNSTAKLKDMATEMRKNLLKLCYHAGALHIGGDLSMTDIMTALYGHAMKHDPKNPKWPERDRFILSKGHGAGALYMSLAISGYFTVDHVIENYDKLDSPFGIHPSDKIPGVEISTGSLGHGLPISIGMALTARLNKQKHRIFTLMGDGEIQEGSVWEGAMAAPQFKLGNLVAIIDRNMISLDGRTEDLMRLEPLGDKWRSFNWNVVEVDGHDMDAIVDVFDNLPDVDSDVPTLIISRSIKGKGVTCMEDQVDWHAGSIDKTLLDNSCAALDACYSKEQEE